MEKGDNSATPSEKSSSLELKENNLPDLSLPSLSQAHPALVANRDQAEPKMGKAIDNDRIFLINNKEIQKQFIEKNKNGFKTKQLEQIENKRRDDRQQKKERKKKKNTKKSHHKCQRCRVKDDKSQMKKCSVCKHYTHFQCIEKMNEKIRFVCHKCQQLNGCNEDKVEKKNQKKLEKQRKKEEFNKCMQKFKSKYWFYYNESEQKLRFPIQDKLLYIYNDIFEQNQQLKFFGREHPTIPPNYLGHFLQIQNFVFTFKDEIGEDFRKQYKKQFLFEKLKNEGSDPIFEKLVATILRIYLGDALSKNKVENVKVLNQNSFFPLLSLKNESNQLTPTLIGILSGQIVKNLSLIPSLRSSFEKIEFPQKFNLDTKTNFIVGLIKGLGQVNTFHDMIAKKSQYITEITRQRCELIGQLKKYDADYLLYRQKLKANVAEGGIKPKCKKAQMSQFDEIEVQKKRARIQVILKQVPFVISLIICLGSDRNHSLYYFYKNEPDRIYVKHNDYIMEEGNRHFIIETKQKIVEFIKGLNQKGIRQKRLYQTINSLIKEDIIRNIPIENLQRDVKLSEERREEQESQIKQKHVALLGQDSLYREKIIRMIMQLESNFSNYLQLKSYRWTSPSKREQFVMGFPFIQNFEAMKSQIKFLHDSFSFVEIVPGYKPNQDDSDSNEQNINSPPIENEKGLVKRKPIRIWGINSQKIRKYWIQYIEKAGNYSSLWLCVDIFKGYANSYVEKKLQLIQEQQKKIDKKKQRQRQLEENREKKNRDPTKLKEIEKISIPKKISPRLASSKHKKFTVQAEFQDVVPVGARTRRKLMQDKSSVKSKNSKSKVKSKGRLKNRKIADSQSNEQESEYEIGKSND